MKVTCEIIKGEKGWWIEIDNDGHQATFDWSSSVTKITKRFLRTISSMRPVKGMKPGESFKVTVEWEE